jgi:short-subunit dehydrogenase
MKKAIIIGASSGIGRELAKQLSLQSYELGLVARREEMLLSLQNELSTPSHIEVIDINDPAHAIEKLERLIAMMGAIDLFIISSGVGMLNSKLEWQKELETIQTNVMGCTAVAGVAMKQCLSQGYGHIAILSSIAALRGGHAAPAYNASKAYLSNYAQGLRKRAAKENKAITITDIKPGFVDTPMARGTGKFWVATPQEAAKQILAAINRKASHVYVTKRWRLVAWLLKLLPDSLYHRM